MGMYTGLRFEAKLKPLVSDAMDLIFGADQDQYNDDLWGALSGIISIDSRWLKFGRRNFIPYGALAYMPEDWSEGNNLNQGTSVWSRIILALF